MKTEIDWYAVITPLLGVVIISILFMVFPENSTETIQTVRVFLGDRCGPVSYTHLTLPTKLEV